MEVRVDRFWCTDVQRNDDPSGSTVALSDEEHASK
jgi:hypothetical protein